MKPQMMNPPPCAKKCTIASCRCRAGRHKHSPGCDFDGACCKPCTPVRKAAAYVTIEMHDNMGSKRVLVYHATNGKSYRVRPTAYPPYWSSRSKARRAAARLFPNVEIREEK